MTLTRKSMPPLSADLKTLRGRLQTGDPPLSWSDFETLMEGLGFNLVEQRLDRPGFPWRFTHSAEANDRCIDVKEPRTTPGQFNRRECRRIWNKLEKKYPDRLGLVTRDRFHVDGTIQGTGEW